VEECRACCDAMAPVCVGFVLHKVSGNCWLKTRMDANATHSNRDSYVAVKSKRKGRMEVLFKYQCWGIPHIPAYKTLLFSGFWDVKKRVLCTTVV
jgi:hypothetical protein